MFHSSEQITPEGFAQLAAARGQAPFRARKVGRVAARRSEGRTPIETRWNGEETVNVADIGDWIVVSLDERLHPMRDGENALNVYVIRDAKFDALYEPDPDAPDAAGEYGRVFRPKSVVQALHLPDGFDIVAPWGARERCDAGYLVMNGDEVYGVHQDVFDRTYERLDAAAAP